MRPVGSSCLKNNELGATCSELHVCKLVQLGNNISVFVPFGKEIVFGISKQMLTLIKSPARLLVVRCISSQDDTTSRKMAKLSLRLWRRPRPRIHPVIAFHDTLGRPERIRQRCVGGGTRCHARMPGRHTGRSWRKTRWSKVHRRLLLLLQ
jgi:hypothetical protein